jgi:amidase
VPWRESSRVLAQDLTVAYCPEDPAAPVSPEVADAVGAAAQALARHGVNVEPAHPPGFVHVARELDYYWKDLAGTTGRTVVEVYSMWDDYRSNMLAFMARFDAILCPAGPQPAPAYRERDNARFAYTVPFNLTGYPVLVIRTGQDTHGMPIGLQVAARSWREDIALALGRMLEQELGGWQRPVLV